MFSRVSSLFALVLVLALFSFGQITTNATDALPTLYFDHIATFSSDTMAGSTTADTILEDFSPRAGFDYVLNFGTWTGSGSDSVAIEVTIEALNSSSRRLSSIVVDTLTVAAGEQTLLQFSRAVAGDLYRVILKGITGAGSYAIPEDSVHVYRRKWFNYNGR